MSIAIADEHRALTESVAAYLERNGAVAGNRSLLETRDDVLPSSWKEIADLGWLGLHLPEEVGGSGYGVLELAIVVEQFGRHVAAGPFVPTVVASAAIAATASEEVRQRLLPGLADGSRAAAVALAAEVSVTEGTLSGRADTVLGAPVADLLVIPVGDDIALVDRSDPGVEVTVPENVDPARRSARVQMSGARAEIVAGGRRVFTDLARVLFAAEAAGVSRACTEQASAYAKVRTQFGRPIGVFQAVKHHCANMAVEAEVATAVAWDGARAAATGGDQLTYAGALAAALAVPGAVSNAQLNIQVHGGIGYTWEHDAHLFLRRALAIAAVIDAAAAAEEVTALTARHVKRSRSLELPPEAEGLREEVRAFVTRVAGLDAEARAAAMLEDGYLLPHWPKPYGRDAGPVEQIVIEQEFEAAALTRSAPDPISSYITLTLIENGSAEQVARFVPAALRRELIWCQLFSEPDAGSDAAGIKTRGKRVEGGWVVNGQKVWTSGAHRAAVGLATVRTNPDAPKHKGITMMLIDMKAAGVTIRPLRQLTGGSEFNEVFLEDVFVPDSDVVGDVDAGWRVARATLGNESVSIGRGVGAQSLPADDLVAALAARPGRLPGGAGRLGRYFGAMEANQLMNLRNVQRAVGGSGPGAEAAINKLVFSEAQQEGASIAAALADGDLAYLDGEMGWAAANALSVRVWTIGGGTSEIKRNQIGELVLGLPRDPLLA